MRVLFKKCILCFYWIEQIKDITCMHWIFKTTTFNFTSFKIQNENIVWTMPITMQNQLWCNEQVHSAENITIKLDQMHFLKNNFRFWNVGENNSAFYNSINVLRDSKNPFFVLRF